MDRKGWKVTGTLALKLSDYMKVTIDEHFFHLCIMKVQIENVQQWTAKEEKESVAHTLSLPKDLNLTTVFIRQDSWISYIRLLLQLPHKIMRPLENNPNCQVTELQPEWSLILNWISNTESSLMRIKSLWRLEESISKWCNGNLHILRIILWMNRILAQTLCALPLISAQTESPGGGALQFTDRIATGCLILGQASKGWIGHLQVV